MIGVNAAANAVPINGVNTGVVSDSYPNLFAPSGITFSIWGLIYLLLGMYTLYQFGLFQKDKGKKNNTYFKLINPYFILSSVANTAWIFAWHYFQIGLTVILMSVILFSLIKIADVINRSTFRPKETLFIRAPFSIYFGWITVATIANITAFLVGLGWDGFGIPQQSWMIIILFVGTLIGIVRTLKDKNIMYGMVFVWAYFGIWIKHTSSAGFNNQYKEVIATVVFCPMLFLIANGFVFLKKKTA